MLNLDRLEAAREAATVDKADLFDFYNRHWDSLVAEVEKLQGKRDMQDAAVEARTLKKVISYLEGWGCNEEIIKGVETGECLKK